MHVQSSLNLSIWQIGFVNKFPNFMKSRTAFYLPIQLEWWGHVTGKDSIPTLYNKNFNKIMQGVHWHPFLSEVMYF